MAKAADWLDLHCLAFQTYANLRGSRERANAHTSILSKYRHTSIECGKLGVLAVSAATRRSGRCKGSLVAVVMVTPTGSTYTATPWRTLNERIEGHAHRDPAMYEARASIWLCVNAGGTRIPNVSSSTTRMTGTQSTKKKRIFYTLFVTCIRVSQALRVWSFWLVYPRSSRLCDHKLFSNIFCHLTLLSSHLTFKTRQISFRRFDAVRNTWSNFFYRCFFVWHFFPINFNKVCHSDVFTPVNFCQLYSRYREHCFYAIEIRGKVTIVIVHRNCNGTLVLLQGFRAFSLKFRGIPASKSRHCCSAKPEDLDPEHCKASVTVARGSWRPLYFTLLLASWDMQLRPRPPRSIPRRIHPLFFALASSPSISHPTSLLLIFSRPFSLFVRILLYWIERHVILFLMQKLVRLRIPTSRPGPINDQSSQILNDKINFKCLYFVYDYE